MLGGLADRGKNWFRGVLVEAWWFMAKYSTVRKFDVDGWVTFVVGLY